MGIGFRFRTSPCVWGSVSPQLEQLAEKVGAWLETGQNGAWVSICRAGGISLEYREGRIVGDCQTNVAGPGFHAAAIGFLDTLAQQSGLLLEVEDETEYYQLRDFERLRQEHFHTWLASLLKVLEEQSKRGQHKNLLVCWDIGKYTPADVPGTVVFPTGRYHVGRLLERVQCEGVEGFAKEFFLWNEQQRDACFYRNSALNILWEDCHFMPSERSEQDASINRNVLNLLEYAAELDATLPFPKREYLDLCALDGRDPVDIAALPAYQSEYPVGYRKETISVRLGNLSVFLPGSYLYEQQNGGRDNVYYDGAYENWHSVRITAFGGTEGRDTFSNDLFAPFSGRTEQFQVGDGRCCAAFAGAVEDHEDGGVYYNVVAEVLSGTQVTLITLAFQQEQEKRWAIQLLKSMKAAVKAEG